MQDLAIITGGGTGLGRAIALGLAQRGYPLLIVGRRSGPLLETAQLAAASCEVVVADIATTAGRAAVADAVGARQVAMLVHNAAVLTPVGPLATLAEDEWRQAMQVNVDAPLFLTQALLPRLAGGRVLHISSGAARNPLAGWGAYCVSKAALFMLYQMLNAEHDDFAVASVRPGVVDTPMQELIRGQDPADFPAVERFRRLQQEGQLRSPEEVADFICWVLTETSTEAYIEREWDISDASQTAQWRQARS
jgi:NAD(P)-dependent dehydrogenase (short-subunit alcohol dehydrogenase family)